MSVNWITVRKVVQLAKPDWKPIRVGQPSADDAANEAAYNLTEAVINAYNEVTQVTCSGCQTRKSPFAFFRCWDCRAYLCEDCIKGHSTARHIPHPKLVEQYESEIADLRTALTVLLKDANQLVMLCAVGESKAATDLTSRFAKARAVLAEKAM